MNALLRVLGVTAALASIISLAILAFSDETQTIVALASIIFFLFAVSFKIYYEINKHLGTRYPKGYRCISNIVRYSTVDGSHYRHETFKHIQSKTFMLNRFDFGFHWTGTFAPTLSSNFQKIGDVSKGRNGLYDNIHLEVDPPLLYSDVGVIHLVMDVDDRDGKASPHLDTRIAEPIHFISWHVELRHAPSSYSESAELVRRRTGSETPNDYEVIRSVPFDPVSKSFRESETRPEVGYYYRIRWKKPSLALPS